MRSIVLLLVLGTACLGGGPARGDDAGAPTKVAAKDCRFSVPDGWASYTLRWEGGCAAGLSDGKGALVATSNGKVARIFFGSMHGGELAIGVVDTPDGFVAGKFKGGKVIDTDDRSQIIRSFQEATAAAKSVSDHFKSLGKAASAKFYAEKAKALNEQMD
jgi:hypothetical protein